MVSDETQTTITISVSNLLIGGVFGKLDENVKKIERAFSVQVVNRGTGIAVTGDASKAKQAAGVIEKLAAFLEKGSEISEQTVNYLISEAGADIFSDIEKINDDIICLTVSGKPIKPKTLGQKRYVDQIRANTVIFGTGPAGTGKTYLAMAMAVTAFKRAQVSRIILTRPAIEAGEKLGFLPGDLQQKVDPYLRPLYDALYDIMGADAFLKNMERGLIEVAPLAYMRGRTLDNSFIVLDEAQNTTHEQMKMFLTRLGTGSKAVITGDLTQIDLPSGKECGLTEAVMILKNTPDIGILALTDKDVVRHPLVQQIIRAYERHEHKPKPKLRRVRRQL